MERNDVDELLEREPDRVSSPRGRARPTRPGCRCALCAVRRGRDAGAGGRLGHQSLAQEFGGQVVRGEPVHGKTAELEHDGRTIYAVSNPRSWSVATTAGRRGSCPDTLEGQRPRRRRDHGHAARGAARRGRAVPPRVRAHTAAASRCCGTSSGEQPGPHGRDRPGGARRGPDGRGGRAGAARGHGGQRAEAQTAGFLIALRTKGETVQEIAGLAATMRELALPVDAGATWSTPPAPAAAGRPSTSRRRRRRSPRAPAAGWPSTATARPPASAVGRRAGGAGRAHRPRAGRGGRVHRGGRLRLHVRPQAPLGDEARRAGAQGARRAHDLQLPRPADQPGRGAAPGDRRLRPGQARDARGGAGGARHGMRPGSVERGWPRRVLGLRDDPGGRAEGRPAEVYDVSPEQVGLEPAGDGAVAAGTPDQNARVLRDVLDGKPAPSARWPC